MSTPPTKRLLVYVIAGLVVLIVGALGLLSMASGRSDDGVVIDAVGAVDGLVGGMGDAAGALSVPSSTTTEPPPIWVHATVMRIIAA